VGSRWLEAKIIAVRVIGLVREGGRGMKGRGRKRVVNWLVVREIEIISNVKKHIYHKLYIKIININ
jgi:hypothetical protein